MSTERKGTRPAIDPGCVREIDAGSATSLSVRAMPGARRAGFAGLWNGIPKIAVSARAEKGRANEEIAAEIARLFGLRGSAVTQIGGLTSRAKTFRLASPAASVRARLAELASDDQEGRP